MTCSTKPSDKPFRPVTPYHDSMFAVTRCIGFGQERSSFPVLAISEVASISTTPSRTTPIGGIAPHYAAHRVSPAG
jgi:hypothetical protein